MALHLFLNEEAHKKVVEAMGEIQPGKGAVFYGIQVRFDSDGRIYYEVRNDRAPKESLIPTPLRAYVEQLSWWDNLALDCPTRDVGRYEHQSASAAVEEHPSHLGILTVRIDGPALDDVYQLFYQIRAGKARLVERWKTDGADGAVVEAIPAEATSGCELNMGSAGIRITCTSCQARYTIAKEKADGKVVKIRCKKCGATMTANCTNYPAAPSMASGGHSAPVN